MFNQIKAAFINYAIKKGVLCFGSFKTKAGRMSPYFFNTGLFNDGDSISVFGDYYAKTILYNKLQFEMLFGPSYKGIPLVVTTAISLTSLNGNYPISFNRKEEKDHGEGGIIVGAPIKGKVLIIDDVISAGTSVGESVDIIKKEGGTPVGVVIALDRMERGKGELSAVQEVQEKYGIGVTPIITLDDLIEYLQDSPMYKENLNNILSYREKYGVK